MNNIERHACFGGWQEVYQHTSTTLNCEMKFAIYLPAYGRWAKISGFILVIWINLVMNKTSLPAKPEHSNMLRNTVLF